MIVIVAVLIAFVAGAACDGLSVGIDMNPSSELYHGGDTFYATLSGPLPPGHCGTSARSPLNVYIWGHRQGDVPADETNKFERIGILRSRVAVAKQVDDRWRIDIPTQSFVEGDCGDWCVCENWSTDCVYFVRFNFYWDDCVIDSAPFRVDSVEYGGALTALDFQMKYHVGDTLKFKFNENHPDAFCGHEKVETTEQLCMGVVEKDWFSNDDVISDCLPYDSTDGTYKWTVPASTQRSSGCGWFSDPCTYAAVVQTRSRLGGLLYCRVFSPKFFLEGVRWKDENSNNFAGGALLEENSQQQQEGAGWPTTYYVIVALGLLSGLLLCLVCGFAFAWARQRWASAAASSSSSPPFRQARGGRHSRQRSRFGTVETRLQTHKGSHQ